MQFVLVFSIVVIIGSVVLTFLAFYLRRKHIKDMFEAPKDQYGNLINQNVLPNSQVQNPLNSQQKPETLVYKSPDLPPMVKGK